MANAIPNTSSPVLPFVSTISTMASTSSSDVLILALGVALAALYLFRDSLFAASKPKAALTTSKSLNDAGGNSRDFVAKMKAGVSVVILCLVIWLILVFRTNVW